MLLGPIHRPSKSKPNTTIKEKKKAA